METDGGKYAGMTVNERLYEAGVIEEWDKAASSKDRERMIELLAKVELAEQAEQIAEAALSGFKSDGF
jgi:hypothetical protein